MLCFKVRCPVVDEWSKPKLVSKKHNIYIYIYIYMYTLIMAIMKLDIKFIVNMITTTDIYSIVQFSACNTYSKMSRGM